MMFQNVDLDSVFQELRGGLKFMSEKSKSCTERTAHQIAPQFQSSVRSSPRRQFYSRLLQKRVEDHRSRSQSGQKDPKHRYDSTRSVQALWDDTAVLLQEGAHWDPHSIDSPFRKPLEVAGGDPGIPMLFQNLFGVRTFGNIQITLSASDGPFEWGLRYPPLQDKPRPWVALNS